MPDSESRGNKPLSGVGGAAGPPAKTTAQSARGSRLASVDVGGALLRDDAQATQAARDCNSHTIAAENRTPQGESLSFWGILLKTGKKQHPPPRTG